MERQRAQFGPWEVECLPDDGARVSVLRFEGLDLLTSRPEAFVPRPDRGRFETREAYGYDDCFPTVDACRYPVDPPFDIPDHGELLWLPWQVRAESDRLVCSVAGELLPVTFTRTMVFSPCRIEWR
ncbi:hypothetical protein LCGC14_2991220, partial [marine sediment metagenome]